MDYLNLLKNIEYTSYLFAGIKWFFIFLLAGVAILFIASKLKLFHRHSKAGKILVKIYFLLIPLYFVVFSLKFSGVRNTQLEFERIIDSNKIELAKFANDFFVSLAADSAINMDASAQSIVETYLRKYIYSSSSGKENNVRFVGAFLERMKRKIEFEFLCRLLETKITKYMSSTLSLHDKSSDAIYCTDFTTLFQKGEIVEIFKLEIRQLFNGFYKTMFLIFGAGLLIPITDYLLSRAFKY